MAWGFQFDAVLSHRLKDKAVMRAVAERLKKDELKVCFDAWTPKADDNIAAKIEKGSELSCVIYFN